MPHSGVYIAILILVNLNYFIECGEKRQTMCLKELNAFSVPKTTANASSDTRPNICSTVFGCCNKTIEDEMKTHITQKLMNLIHGRNERLRRQFEDFYDDLEGLFQRVFEETAGSTIESLKVKKGNIAQHVKPQIRTLFEELKTSVTSKDLQVANSTTKFFSNFYPIVHQNDVARTKLPNEFAQCLKKNVHVILPFKDVPQKMKDFLIKKLIPVQVFLRSLQTVGHVLDVIDNVELSKECGFTLVEMSYCSLCDGINDAKPCLNYCTDVVSACLEPYSVVEEKWSSYMIKLDNFCNLLAKSLDASILSAKFQEFFSDSMSHASHSDVQKMVLKHCGNMTNYNQNKIISLNAKKQSDSPTRDLGNGDIYIESLTTVSYEHLTTANDINNRLRFLRRNLTFIRNHMKMFPINLCLNDGLSASAIDGDNCWVGTGLGRYNDSGVIKNITALRPANNNTIVDDVSLLLRKATNGIRKVQSRPWKDDGSGSGADGSASGEGSGGSGEPTLLSYSGDDTDCNDDDEDCAKPSGQEESVSYDTKKNTVDEERSTQSTESSLVTPGSEASTFYCTQTLLVGLLLLYRIFSR